jgi:hypothetical protein
MGRALSSDLQQTLYQASPGSFSHSLQKLLDRLTHRERDALAGRFDQLPRQPRASLFLIFNLT